MRLKAFRYKQANLVTLKQYGMDTKSMKMISLLFSLAPFFLAGACIWLFIGLVVALSYSNSTTSKLAVVIWMLERPSIWFFLSNRNISTFAISGGIWFCLIGLGVKGGKHILVSGKGRVKEPLKSDLE